MESPAGLTALGYIGIRSARLDDWCQVPSWNENMKCFSDLAINSENISRRYSHY